ncbi:MAG TPA: hypothetical protein DCR43_01395 [Bacteroidales bacterium]|nr:MAG: hypothetical protein A2X11_13970 [Bacteroidetes bacterium GWE2_42_24]OFY28299.1 MAG: hypothetical protein A2X09_16170 [Bacteroidetes bacterium GWF2_43_11]PKP27871.1 MAG: hypothetical protein CVU06_00745 [Bacteroidetes bacterium HGW-Bacteroidetes-22]HAQ64505.1 hypothetical protein [Bacteroidales bacterium]HBZ66213.1 hypothetical protein [Bacteroidales bacterium]
MKILVLLSRVPWPLEKGDKLRAYHQIRHLAQRHTVILFAVTHQKLHTDALTQIAQICDQVHIEKISWHATAWNMLKAWFANRPVQSGYFFSRKGVKRLKEIYYQEKPDHVYCQLARMAEYARAIPGPRTIDYQDVFSEGVRRRMEKSSFWLRPVFRLEYKRMVRYETDLFDHFDGHTIISEADRELIRHPDRDTIRIIENGVDTDFFHEIVMEKKYDLVFTGNMSYPPNVLAAEYLVNQILPECLREGMNPTVLIAGATPSTRVKALASATVTVSGWLDDIRYSYAESRIFIAPMQIGTGLQNKLLEAMAMRIPAISSPLANAALNAIPGTEILIGDSPEAYSRHIAKLLKDQQSAEVLATAGQNFVKRRFNWNESVLKLEQEFSQG